MSNERASRPAASSPKGRPTPSRRDAAVERAHRSATLAWIAVAAAVIALVVGAAVVADGDGRRGGHTPMVVHGG